jgi:uncharacterized damage-inducible protein DinB
MDEAKIYETAAKLSAEELSKNSGAFFGSITGTLNHIAIADTICLKRLAPLLQNHQELNFIREQSLPQSLDVMLFSTIEELYDYRKLLDSLLSELAKSITVRENEDRLDQFC